MKLVKLALISLIAFGGLFLGITLLFPYNTIISRVINIGGPADAIKNSLRTNRVSLQQVLAGNGAKLLVKSADIPFYENTLFNKTSAETVPTADTIFFEVQHQQKTLVQGGVAMYQLTADSTTTQMFYVFQTPWYKPLLKMKMMMADKLYGPGLDSALHRLRFQLQSNP